LRQALVNSEFEINFQPLYETSSDKLRGFEALLRLQDDDGKPIPPSEFIPIAEEIGLISDIGNWVLRESCRMAKQWPDDLVVAVNLSPAQFGSNSMADNVTDVLEWSGLPARRLELEVTESLLITDTEKVLAELMAIKALGVSIALDDFGTGYSSLSYLWRFPFDKLKVDKSFMSDVAVEGSKSREILATIIALGRVLDLKVTAEGVETEEQAEVLRELDCDLVQGYLFGRPMRAIDVAATVIRSADLQASRALLLQDATPIKAVG
jgi:EAL domain-containing protein (putative c-di-GMP-specific phosphodiesterase class I)